MTNRVEQFIEVQKNMEAFNGNGSLLFLMESIFSDSKLNEAIDICVTEIVRIYDELLVSYLNVTKERVEILDLNSVTKELYDLQMYAIAANISLSTIHEALPEAIEMVKQSGLELFAKKNQDYGDAFARFSVVGVIMRMGDKISRLDTLRNKRDGMFESIQDTTIDLYNYAVMACMLLDE